MGTLGKDLFDIRRPRRNTKVEFGESCYWVESNPVPQPYGTILTEILNLDAAPYQAVMDRLDDVVKHKNSKEAPRAYLDMLSVSAELPLYRLYATDYQMFKNIPVEMLVVGEAREAFEEHVIEQKSDTPVFVQKQLDDIRFIQERYAWFLDSMFKGVGFEKKKGQRKESLAKQVYLHNLGAFVSGVSLGADPKVDAPQVKTQYRMRGEVQGECEIVEKMYFNGLLDFVYVEMMKGLQKGFVPKRCANCRRWFLQTPGATYSYCNEPAPGQGGKTCREIGAAKSFKEKVDNNDIWKVHQRAYKKYFARVSKGKMSKPDFEVWAREAERIRDEALAEDEMAKDKAAHEQIVRRLTEELNRA